MASLQPKNATGEEAEVYYEAWTQRYLDTYGEIIQAYRTRNPGRLLRSIIRASGMGAPMRVLDAGCGVCGPSVFFARKTGVQIEAVTISPAQVDLARQRIAEAGLTGKISVRKGDFHQLSGMYDSQSFDLILFLESLGHSAEPQTVLRETDFVLRTGGSVYIKDFFFKHSDNESERKYIETLVNRVNASYAYHVLDLESLISSARALGWEIEFIRPPEYNTETKTRSTFEARFGIDLYQGLPELPYADWLELKFIKVSKNVYP